MPDLRSLSLKQLRALSAVVRTGSITQAAEELSVTPPAVASHLKTLESLVGGPMLQKSADGMAPTPLARELIHAADEIESVIGRAANRLRALRAGAAGSLVFGAVSTGKYFAPSIVAAFQKEHPNIEVTLSIGNRQAVIAGFERGDFDVVIMGRPPGHLELERVVLGDHPHILIAPPDHRLVDDLHVIQEDLLQETVLWREEGSGTRILMNRFLERIGDGRPFKVTEMGTIETIKQAVMAGLGVAIISAHTCEAELREHRLAVIKAPGLPLVRQWVMLRRTDMSISEAAEVFWNYVRGAARELLPKV